MKNAANLPALPENQFYLERPRIYSLLEKAMKNYLAVISAGEGYGKTYAVHSFLRSRPELTLWIQLTERDNQPWHFWENYVKTIEFYNPALAKKFIKLGFPETSQQFNRFFPELAGEFGGSRKCAVVFDDFHYIRDRRIIKLIEQFLASFIPGHTLVLISRNEPAINFIPVLSKGRLVRLSTEDLLFTARETADYFRLRDLPLSAGEIAAIHRDTEGWAIGINLIAEELKKSGRKYTLRLFEQGFVRLLEDRIFTGIPEVLQRYLVKLSLLDQWPLDLLERTAVDLPGEYRQMPVLLAELRKLSAFIWYDCYLHAYRVHHAFLDYLREKQKELPERELRQICATAAGWYLENNLKMDAALNFERACDYEGIAGILNTFPLFIPPAAAVQLLDIIDRLSLGPGENGEDEHYVYLQIICRGRLLFCLSRYAEAQKVFRESIDHFESLPPSPFHSRILLESWLNLGFLGMINHRFDRKKDFISCFVKADYYVRQYRGPQPVGGLTCPISSYVIQISHPAAAGDFEKSIEDFTSGIPRSLNVLNGLLYGIDELLRTELAFFQGKINTAEQFARLAIFKAREKNQYETEHKGLCFLMRIALHRSNIGELLEVLRQIETLAATPDYVNSNVIFDIAMGWLNSHLGETKKVAFWLRDQSEESEAYSMFHNFESMVKAKYLFGEGEYGEVLSFVNLEENKNGLGSFLLGMLEMGCLEAAARIRLGDKKGAVKTLESLWQAASPNSLDMLFIETGEDMRLLAAAAIESGSIIPRSWLENIRDLAAAYGKNLFRLAEQYRAAEGSGEKTGIYLTRPERTVLALLAQGHTREEISGLTRQSLGQIKNIIQKTYGKLGAINRTDAIRIAFSLGILEKTRESLFENSTIFL